jgi:hypothetical protein
MIRMPSILPLFPREHLVRDYCAATYLNKSLHLSAIPLRFIAAGELGRWRAMNEKLFNLFLFVTGDIIHEIGAMCHEQAGSDAQKLAFLQSQVAADFPAAKRYPVPDRYMLAGDRGAAVPGGLR